MRWTSRAKQKHGEWHRWFAWHPVRIPSDVYQDGMWIWREYIERQGTSDWEGGIDWSYRFESKVQMSWGLRAQIDELRAEIAALKADAAWRHEWHERLGRGNMTEGKFYEMLLSVKLWTRVDIAEGNQKCCPAKPGEGCPVSCPDCEE